jgi:hypothetical protein
VVTTDAARGRPWPRAARIAQLAGVVLIAGSLAGGAGAVPRTALSAPSGAALAAPDESVRYATALAESASARQPPAGTPVVFRQTDAAFDDTLGDAATGPDIARVAVVNDAAGNVGIGVSYANRTCATGSDLVFVDLDVDQNAATGTPLGIDYLLFVDVPGNRRGVARWDGSLFQPVAVSTLQAGCNAQGFDSWSFNRTELGIGSGFNFYTSACADASRAQCGDLAPNALPLWNYQLSATPPAPPAPPPTPPPPSPPPTPAPPPTPPARTAADAPRLPKRSSYTGASIRHGKLAPAIYATMKVVGGGRQLQVACWSKPDWSNVLADLGAPERHRTAIQGFWIPAQKRFLHLSPTVCGYVQALMSSRRANGDRAWASTVALHEAAHMYGIRNEAEATCYAVQLVYFFARRVGFAHPAGLRMERLAVRTTRTRVASGYWDASRCRDGGAWDLDEENLNLNY